jgi:hypothetical protein
MTTKRTSELRCEVCGDHSGKLCRPPGGVRMCPECADMWADWRGYGRRQQRLKLTEEE